MISKYAAHSTRRWHGSPLFGAPFCSCPCCLMLPCIVQATFRPKCTVSLHPFPIRWWNFRSGFIFRADIILNREHYKQKKNPPTQITDQRPNHNLLSAPVPSPPAVSDTDTPSHHSQPHSYTAPGSSTPDKTTVPPPCYSNYCNYNL